MAPENANDVVSSCGSLCGAFAPDPRAVPEVSPNCFDKGACFYLMLGLSRPVIDAGLSKAAAALIVFKTTYLSYECFIQETKYELVE